MDDIKLDLEKEKTNDTKFCKHCGSVIHKDALICPKCGLQVEEFKSDTQSNVVINNNNENINNNTNVNSLSGLHLKQKNKWISLLLCIFLGYFGAHKFYEGKIGMGILYIFTMGIFGIGVLIDFIKLLFKPNPYFV